MSPQTDTQNADRVAADNTFDPMRFVKTWNRIEGNTGIGDTLEIEYDKDADLYDLCAEGTRYQRLRYDPVARTLVDAEDRGPYRCISFWDQPINGKYRIFAMRLPRSGDIGDPSDCLLPWELGSPDRGTWGAEEG